MPTVCTGCGEANPDSARFCSQCGAPLRALAAERATETTSLIVTGAEISDTDVGYEPETDAAAVGALPPGTALLLVKRGPNASTK